MSTVESRPDRSRRHDEYCDIHQSHRHAPDRHGREEYTSDEVRRHPLDLAITRREVAVAASPRGDQRKIGKKIHIMCPHLITEPTVLAIGNGIQRDGPRLTVNTLFLFLGYRGDDVAHVHQVACRLLAVVEPEETASSSVEGEETSSYTARGSRFDRSGSSCVHFTLV